MALASGRATWISEQLVGHGYTVEHEFLRGRRGELGALLVVAGRTGFNLTKDGHLRSSSAWQSNCAVGQGAC